MDAQGAPGDHPGLPTARELWEIATPALYEHLRKEVRAKLLEAAAAHKTKTSFRIQSSSDYPSGLVLAPIFLRIAEELRRAGGYAKVDSFANGLDIDFEPSAQFMEQFSRPAATNS